MSESGDDSRTTAVGRKRKQVSEAEVWGATAAAAASAAASAAATGRRGVKSRRLSMASKESGDMSSSEASASRRSSNAFSSYDDFRKTAGQDRPQVSFSLRGASRPSHSVDVSNHRQSNPLGDASSEEDGEIVESSDASTSMSESSTEEASEASDDESDSAPSHARASASPDSTAHADHANTANTSTMVANSYPDGLLRLHQLSDKDQDEQYRYFGLKYDDDIIYCMCCGDRGHRARTCPTRRCTHCNAYDKHASHACPTYRRCTRCRQRGHDAPDCTNPQPTIITNDPCDVCGETGHVEEECAKLWHTSLNPPLKVLRKGPERDMYKVCYNCGDSGYDGHWGDDCPDRYYNARTQGPNVVKTWSKEDAARFTKEGDGTDEEDANGEDEAEEKIVDDEPAPAPSRNWQVGLFDE